MALHKKAGEAVPWKRVLWSWSKNHTTMKEAQDRWWQRKHFFRPRSVAESLCYGRISTRWFSYPWKSYNWFNEVSRKPYFWPNSLYRVKMNAQPGASFRWLRECTCEAVKHCLNHKVRSFILYFWNPQRLLQARFALHKWMSHSHPYIHTYVPNQAVVDVYGTS